MSKRTFTDDETGQKYETAKTETIREKCCGWKHEKVIAIKPVVEKSRYNLELQEQGGSRQYLAHGLKLSEPQIQAVAAMLKAAMEYVTGAPNTKRSYFSEVPLAVDARKAFLKEDTE